MTPAQLERQIPLVLGNQVWPDSPSQKILAIAIASPKSGRELVGQLTTPFAVVHHGDLEGDEDQNTLYSYAEFVVELVVENWTDCYGTASAVGGSRESAGQSGGRGANEVLEELRNLLAEFMDSTHGFRGYSSSTSKVETINGVAYLIATFRIVVRNATSSRFYHPVYKPKGTAPGGGVATLTWSLPPTRWDLLRVICRRSAAGGAVPTSSIDGIAVPLTGDPNLGASATVTSLTPGTYQFVWFVAYDETNNPTLTEQRYSAAVSLALVVT